LRQGVFGQAGAAVMVLSFGFFEDTVGGVDVEDERWKMEDSVRNIFKRVAESF
jgi:hypothetical protein